MAIDKHLRDCLQQAIQIEDPEQHRRLLTVAIIGGGPSGIEMAATLANSEKRGADRGVYFLFQR